MKMEAIAASTNLYIMGTSPTLTRDRGGCAQPPLAYFAYFGSLKAIRAEAAGIFSSCGNNAGSKSAA